MPTPRPTENPPATSTATATAPAPAVATAAATTTSSTTSNGTPASAAPAAETITTVPIVEGGLPALGSAYQGMFEAMLEGHAAAVAPARKRLQQALDLLQELRAIATEGLPEASLQAAWHLMRMVPARALAYDLRTLEEADCADLAKQLDDAVEATAMALLEVLPGDWTAAKRQQLQWPTQLGGLGLGSAQLQAGISRLACLAQCLPVARAHLARMATASTAAEIVQAIPLEVAEATMARLKADMGIELTAEGKIAKGKEPRLDLATLPKPLTGITGELTRAIQGQQYTDCLSEMALKETEWRDCAKWHKRAKQARAAAAAHRIAEAHQRDLARLRSAHGAGTHDLFDMGPTENRCRLTDAETSYALRWRLGLALQAEPRSCQLRKSGNEPGRHPCGKHLDAMGDHCLFCSRGPGRYRVHNAIVQELYDVAKEVGAQAEVEEVCPQLLKGAPGSQEAVEARLDLHTWVQGSHGPRELWIDVAHTHPAGAKLLRQATQTPRAAASSTEKRKAERYGEGQGGVYVHPFVVEAFGGFSDGACTVLDIFLAAWCRRRGTARHTPASTRRRWRAGIGAAMYRAQASIFLQAHKEPTLDQVQLDDECSDEEEGEPEAA